MYFKLLFMDSYIQLLNETLLPSHHKCSVNDLIMIESVINRFKRK